jgi:hypothetical protein
MGRPKGAKNRRTLLREAEQKLRSVNREDYLDALVVLEESMRHFYTRAVLLKSNPKASPEEIDANLMKAVDIAEKVMPYRHHRLAAIKLDKDPIMNGIRENATVAELEAEMKKHWLRLAPVLDLEAMLAPSDGVANREVAQDGAARDAGE